MLNLKKSLQLLFVAACLAATAGCASVSFNPAGGDRSPATAANTAKYRIAAAEVATLTPQESAAPLTEPELNLLLAALKSGNWFGAYWAANTPGLNRIDGEQKVTDDTAAFQSATRISAPCLFDNVPDAVPIRIKAVTAIRPARLSPWWLSGYLLSVSMVPMCESSLGTAIVTVLDKSDKTLGAKVIVFRRSRRVSGLLPTALLCGGRYSASQCGLGDLSDREKMLLTQIMADAVIAILNDRGAARPADNPAWVNLRSAIVEAVVTGNNDSAVTLLKLAEQQSLGGQERQAMLDLID